MRYKSFRQCIHGGGGGGGRAPQGLSFRMRVEITITRKRITHSDPSFKSTIFHPNNITVKKYIFPPTDLFILPWSGLSFHNELEQTSFIQLAHRTSNNSSQRVVYLLLRSSCRIFQSFLVPLAANFNTSSR